MSLWGDITGFIQNIPGVQGVEQFLGGNGGKNALGVAEGLNAAMLQGRQNDLANKALQTAQQSYNERQPLRSQGISQMLDPSKGIAPQIAALTANSSNPFTLKMPQTPQVAPAGPPGGMFAPGLVSAMGKGGVS